MTKRPNIPEDDVPPTKGVRGDDCDEEDEEISAEEKLKQLQALAQKESDNTLDLLSVKATAPSSTCSQSHWQHIGSLLLFTAAGVPDSSKVRNELSCRNCVFLCLISPAITRL